MGSVTCRYTSGRMLHFEDCDHFYDDMPPREATPEELTTLPVCGTCAGRFGSGSPAGRSVPPELFRCPSCHMSMRASLRTPSGLCRDCAAP